MKKISTSVKRTKITAKTKAKTRKNKPNGGGLFCTPGSTCSKNAPKIYMHYTYDTISNGDILAFILKDLITDQQVINLGNLIQNNLEFIDSIVFVKMIDPSNNCPVSAIMNVINNTKIPLDYAKNEQLRKLVNDIIQWLLFDYSNELRISLFEILYETFLDNNFLLTSDDTTNFNILLQNVQQVIMIRTNELYNTGGVSDPKYEPLFCAITLLRIILKFLNDDTTKQTVMGFINPNQRNIKKYRTSILCILKYLITEDSLKNDKVRILISDYIKDMTLHNNFSTWITVVTNGATIIGNCSGSIFLNLVGF
jgi:hypothetical protein